MSTAIQKDRSFPDVDRYAFDRSGYVVVKGLFGLDEIERLREITLDTLAEYEQEGRGITNPGGEGATRGLQGDLLGVSSLRHVLLDARVLGVVSTLLGGTPSYFGDSAIRVDKNGERGWHRDNVNRRRWRGGPDWQGDPYPLLRCGLYMQDQANFSGGVALRPGSNRLHRRLPTRAKLVQAYAGDLVVWSLRTVHSAEAVRMRGVPQLALHPRIQTLLPASLRVPDERKRVVIFMTFGLPGQHLNNYLTYLNTRDYMRDVWDKSQIDSEVWEQAESAGLKVMRSLPGYGTWGGGTES